MPFWRGGLKLEYVLPFLMLFDNVNHIHFWNHLFPKYYLVHMIILVSEGILNTFVRPRVCVCVCTLHTQHRGAKNTTTSTEVLLWTVSNSLGLLLGFSVGTWVSGFTFIYPTQGISHTFLECLEILRDVMCNYNDWKSMFWNGFSTRSEQGPGDHGTHRYSYSQPTALPTLGNWSTSAIFGCEEKMKSSYSF